MKKFELVVDIKDGIYWRVLAADENNYEEDLSNTIVFDCYWRPNNNWIIKSGRYTDLLDTGKFCLSDTNVTTHDIHTLNIMDTLEEMVCSL